MFPYKKIVRVQKPRDDTTVLGQKMKKVQAGKQNE